MSDKMKKNKKDQEEDEVSPETKRMIKESIERNKKFLKKLAEH